MRAFKVSDLLAIRLPSTDFITIHALVDSERDGFTAVSVSKNNFNILQLAVINKFYNVVNYILSEHKVIASNR